MISAVIGCSVTLGDVAPLIREFIEGILGKEFDPVHFSPRHFFMCRLSSSILDIAFLASLGAFALIASSTFW